MQDQAETLPGEVHPFGTLVAPDISRMLRQGDEQGVRQAMENMLGPEVTDVLMALSPQERLAAFRLLPREREAEVLPYLPEDQRRQLVEEVEPGQLAGIFNEMDPDDRTELLEDMSERQVEKVLLGLHPDERRQAEELLEYPFESVGRLATPDYLAVHPDWTVKQVLDYIREHGGHAETLETLFVVDDQEKLIDDVPLRRVLLSQPEEPVKSILDGHVVSLRATDDREQAVRAMEHYDQPVLPVIDDDGTMVGIVTFDDVADVAEEEATEDFHKTAAVAPLPLGYTQTRAFSLFRRRIGWLIILVFVNLISSGVIATFEETLQAMIALAFFLPLLIDSGGNTGSQAATLMVRALATHDVRLSQWLHTLGKELLVGVALGVCMGLASALLGLFRGGDQRWEVAFIAGLSMISIVVVANIIGTLLPFVLTKLRIDPAVASSPLITTIADATGLLIYFSIATWVLRTIA